MCANHSNDCPKPWQVEFHTGTEGTHWRKGMSGSEALVKRSWSNVHTVFKQRGGAAIARDHEGVIKLKSGNAERLKEVE